MSSSIRELPPDVVDKIRSASAITSLNGVVCGLLTNALDAGASKLTIVVDHGRGNCNVEDNGEGVAPAEFEEGGGLGKLHHSSRYPPSLQVHGAHGNFIASLSALCLLTIVSHHRQHESHSSIQLHSSNVLSRRIPCPPDHEFRTYEHGTRVAVSDLFGSLPVRVKHRAALAQDRAHLDREWDALVHNIVAILLPWRRGVSVSVRECVNQRDLRLRAQGGVDASRLSALVGQAALADSDESRSWVPVSASSGSIQIKGFISKDPAASHRAQFLSLGVRPLQCEYSAKILYDEINKAFASSSFGVIDDGHDRAKAHNERGFPKDGLRKGIERWPMFFLRISLPKADASTILQSLDTDQDQVAVIIDVLKAISYGFLKKHYFRPRKIQPAANGSLFSTSTQLGRANRLPKGNSSPSLVSEMKRVASPFDDWQHIKVGRPTGLSSKPQAEVKPAVKETLPLLIGEGGKLLRKPFDDPEPGPVEFAQPEASDHFSDEISVKKEDVKELQLQPSRIRRSLEKRPKAEPSEWLQDILQSWNNPVFPNVEQAVPRTYDDTVQAPTEAKAGTSNYFPCGPDNLNGVVFETGSVDIHGRVSKTSLLDAEVISQVDCKFILLKLPLTPLGAAPPTSSSALIMLDQHAADERVRLEELMASYFDGAGPVVEMLEAPVVFEVTQQECQLLGRFRAHLESWGLRYQMVTSDKQLRVTGLPPSIAERCQSEPRLLIDLLRKEIWTLCEDGAPPTSKTAGPSRFHNCPRGILGLLRSRSCRSAIMFNDVLTHEQCVSLVRKLAKCAFPFQCAHGRPSMAPILDLGSADRGWRTTGLDKTAWMEWAKT